jgi:hypothetical protein
MYQPMQPIAPAPLPLPPPERIRQVTLEVLADPAYHLDTSGWDFGTLRQKIHALLEPLRDLLRQFFEPVGRVFERVADASPAVAWIVMILLVVLAVSLLVHVVYTFVVVMRESPPDALPADPQEQALQDPRAWERRARQAAQQDDFTSAARFLLRTCLLLLAQGGRQPYRRGLTNREYLRQYRRSSVFAPLKQLVELIDSHWYAGKVCTTGDYQLCLQSHAAIRQWAEQASHADSA